MASNRALLALVQQPSREGEWQRAEEPWTLGSCVDDERVDAALDESVALVQEPAGWLYCHKTKQRVMMRVSDTCPHCGQVGHGLDMTDLKELLKSAMSVDPLAWIDMLPVPRERPPKHPGEHASTWRLIVHLVRVWLHRRREQRAESMPPPRRAIEGRTSKAVQAKLDLAQRIINAPQGTRDVPNKPEGWRRGD